MRPEDILRKEKDGKEILYADIQDITIRREANVLKNSRWLSFFFSPYTFEPASARYMVDYRLVKTTSECTHTLLSPFSIELKQVLVDNLGNRVHEIVDPHAPLL